MLDLGMLVLKALAVAGGAAVGWLGSGLLLRLRSGRAIWG